MLAGLLSAFVNNTPIVVLLLPILVSVSLRAGTSASGILMPMGLATLVGGMATTIGTSTNLLVVSVAADLGLRRFGMFDFFVPAVIAGSLGVLYLWLVAPRLLPERQTALTDTSPRIFSAQLNITEESFAVGHTLAELLKKAGSEMKVQRIQRGESVLLPLPDVTIRAGDQLILEDTPAQLKEYEQVLGAHAVFRRARGGRGSPAGGKGPATGGDRRGTGFAAGQPHAERQPFHRSLPACHARPGTRPAARCTRCARISATSACRSAISCWYRARANSWHRSSARASCWCWMRPPTCPRPAKAPLALLIMGLVIVSAATGLLPIAVSAVAGALLMLLFGSLAWRDVGNALSTAVIMIVVVSLALGMALTKTGATTWLADVYLALTPGWRRT